MVRIGFCCPAAEAARAKAAGCEYIELGFDKIACMSDAEFAQTKAQLEEAGLRAEAMNCFVMAKFALYTLQDDTELRAYLTQGLARAKALGTEVVVFGSAGARKLPEGVDKREAWNVLAPYFRLGAELGREYGVTIAIEPLCYAECNAVNTLQEGLALMQLVNHPNLKILADMFHMGENGEDYTDIKLAAADLRHCHIGRPGGRTYPLPDDGYDYRPFFAALKEAGYNRRLSIEAKPANGPEDLAVSVEYLKALRGE